MWDVLFTITCVMITVLIWIALYDSNRFVIRRYEIENPKIRKGCRIVLLADLHNKRYGKDNERLLCAIRECRPDFIMVAGDMITARPGSSPDVAVKLMEALAKEYPVYYGNGNHEHRIKLYPEIFGDMSKRYCGALERCGVRLLANEHAVLAEYGLAVYGLEIARLYYKRFRRQPLDEGYLEGVLGRASEAHYNILLAHNPDYFPQYALWGADLALSGHIHGGIVRIPGLDKGVASPNIRLFPRYSGGVYRQGGSTMILSRGLGMHTIPVRLFNPGEVVVVEFADSSAAQAAPDAKQPLLWRVGPNGRKDK